MSANLSPKTIAGLSGDPLLNEKLWNNFGTHLP